MASSTCQSQSGADARQAPALSLDVLAIARTIRRASYHSTVNEKAWRLSSLWDKTIKGFSAFFLLQDKFALHFDDCDTSMALRSDPSLLPDARPSSPCCPCPLGPD